jgi:hypothetical protein
LKATSVSKLSDFERAKARTKLRSAEAAFRQARDLLGERRGGLGINMALINKIRAAEKSVFEARDALRKVDPTYNDLNLGSADTRLT